MRSFASHRRVVSAEGGCDIHVVLVFHDRPDSKDITSLDIYMSLSVLYLALVGVYFLVSSFLYVQVRLLQNK